MEEMIDKKTQFLILHDAGVKIVRETDVDFLMGREVAGQTRYYINGSPVDFVEWKSSERASENEVAIEITIRHTFNYTDLKAHEPVYGC